MVWTSGPPTEGIPVGRLVGNVVSLVDEGPAVARTVFHCARCDGKTGVPVSEGDALASRPIGRHPRVLNVGIAVQRRVSVRDRCGRHGSLCHLVIEILVRMGDGPLRRRRHHGHLVEHRSCAGRRRPVGTMSRVQQRQASAAAATTSATLAWRLSGRTAEASLRAPCVRVRHRENARRHRIDVSLIISDSSAERSPPMPHEVDEVLAPDGSGHSYLDPTELRHLPQGPAESVHEHDGSTLRFAQLSQGSARPGSTRGSSAAAVVNTGRKRRRRVSSHPPFSCRQRWVLSRQPRR